jgi:hypothetical protein
MAINLTILPDLLKNLPLLTSFTCSRCCGERRGANGQHTLPAQLPTAAPMLKFLRLTSSGVVGTLPTAWGSWKSLEYLDLANNTITGLLPSSFAGMRRLRTLRANMNALTGTLPDAYSASKAMASDLLIYVAGNNLTGSVPNSWLYFSSGTVYVDSHQVYGCLPGGIEVVCCADPFDCWPQCDEAVAALPLCSNISAETASLRGVKVLLHDSAAGQQGPLDSWSVSTGKCCSWRLGGCCCAPVQVHAPSVVYYVSGFGQPLRPDCCGATPAAHAVRVQLAH